MSENPVQTRKASTESVFAYLRRVPWWAVIIGIVGIVVAYSVLTDVRYLDAMQFLFDLPWDKELVAQIPVQSDTWTWTPEAKVPLAPGEYRIVAQFNLVSAKAKEAMSLYQDHDTSTAVTGQLTEGQLATFRSWYIVPRSGLTLEQRWVYVTTESGESGWAQAKSFGLQSYESLSSSEVYRFEIPENAPAQEAEPINAPTGDTVLTLDTSTPTLSGQVEEGSYVLLYNKYDWRRTLKRAWESKGVVLTLRATILGFALAIILGLIAGLMLVSHNPITLAISKLYVEVVRGLPLLVIIIYAGFVVSPYLREMTDGRIDLRGFPGAVIGLGFGYGAYLAEVFRAGIQSINKGQMEAARSLGMTYFQAMRFIILPQAFRVMLPPLGNDFMAMLKDSSLISVVALPEILQQGRLWVSRTFRAFEGYNTVALFYLVMTLLLSLLIRMLERKTALPGQTEE